ncbi:unnamed protein product [Peniophora sp. CBMAI 1063]|nr:unnamed protein product [Peniophora sp. CBMAI 1063]
MHTTSVVVRWTSFDTISTVVPHAVFIEHLIIKHIFRARQGCPGAGLRPNRPIRLDGLRGKFMVALLLNCIHDQTPSLSNGHCPPARLSVPVHGVRTAMEQVTLYVGEALREQSSTHVDHSIWGPALMVLPLFSALSALVFLVQLIFTARKADGKASGSPLDADEDVSRNESGSGKSRILLAGGRSGLAYKVARLVAVVALLSIMALRISGRSVAVLNVLICATYAYATVLAFLDIAAGFAVARLASAHLVTVLLLAFALYAVRDLWPLVTFTLQPIDGYEGPLLWIQVALLGIAGVLVPLCIPRQYVPVEGEIPQKPDELNEEQTASLLSFGTFSYLDRLVMLGYRLRTLSFEQLPPLPDYDRTSYLVKRSFKHFDPFTGAPRRHLFIGILKTFLWQYLSLVAIQVVRVAASLFAPVGINRLLKYIETNGEGAVVRPYIWIALMFFGPLFVSLLGQWYVFTTTSNVVRIRAIITQLVFEHALRIRLFSGDTASGKADGDGPTATKKAESQLLGKINNLVTSDLDSVADGRELIWLIVYSPLLIAASIYFLYEILGWSVFVGLVVMLLSFILPGYTAKRISGIQKEVMKKTDARVQKVTEALQVIRMVKLFGWEHKVADILAVKRDEELHWVRLREIAQLTINLVNYTIPLLQMISIFFTFTVIMKQQLTPSIVFSAIPVFELIRNELHYIFALVPKMIQANVSLERLGSFLHTTELTDMFAAALAEGTKVVPSARPSDPQTIGTKNASFTWTKNAASEGSRTPSSRNFTLCVSDELVFQRNAINLIVGPTGSGKTSLLMALLGELHFSAMGPDSWVNLPRDGGVAYAAQESWVQSDTIRNNILFGAPYDAQRYRKVIHQCALARDLTLFAGGDLTEVGEKGLTLSGGQKARITLARAIYSSAEILLLDDVLAALDAHTARWIVDKCLKGDLVRGRTVILITHNVPLASSAASYMVTLGNDGTIASHGSVAEVLAEDAELAQEAKRQAEELERADQSTNKDLEVEDAAIDDGIKTTAGKLVVEEEVLEGHVSWATLSLYFNALGGRHNFLFWTLFLGGHLISDFIHSVHTYWLGIWAQAYEEQDASDVNIAWYLGVFAALVLAFCAVIGAAAVLYIFGMFRASKQIHRQLVTSVLGTTMRVLDSTPTSRIIARCTQDMRTIDGPFAQEFHAVVEFTSILIIRLCAVVFVTPIFIIPGLLVFIVGAGLGHLYMTSQLAVKRHSSNKAAPVLAHFGGAIHGLVSIRAYGAQAAMRAESYRRIDESSRAARTFANLNRWIGPRLDALGGLFAAGLGAWLIYGPGRGTMPLDVGFGLSMAIGFSAVILFWVRLFNRVEVLGNSLERIHSYVNIEQEPEPAVPRALPAAWPTSGNLRVEGLSARYSPDGPRVLHELNFEVKSGERIGIVGRTGSGKSSLTLSLLRCLYTEGAIYYDGVDTSTIELDTLRSNITIIPQVPELLSGTLRENLDLFGEHDDATLNAALRASGLFSLQKDNDEDNRITLDSQISSGGGNLSIGQRQILALARALVRGSKLLILDEATSSIDYKTDSVIQSSLRHELGGDVTVLIVAHRLQTIMDADRIMVLDAGNIVEFDSPTALLAREGLYKALVEESADKEALYAMAQR